MLTSAPAGTRGCAIDSVWQDEDLADGPAFRFSLDGLSRTDNTIATGQHGVTIPGAPSLTLFKGGFLG